MARQIEANQFLQNLIALQTADHTARRAIAGDVRGVAGNDVAHKLGDGIISLGLQSVVDIHQDILRFIARFLNGLELSGFEFIHGEDSFLTANEKRCVDFQLLLYTTKWGMRSPFSVFFMRIG